MKLFHSALRAAVRVGPESFGRGVARLPFSRFHRATSLLMQGDEVVSWRGLRVRVNPGDIAGFYTYLFGDYARTEVDCLIALGRSASVVFDIGANLGWMSLAIARYCPDTRVVAFEPDPGIARKNADTAALNPELGPRVLLRQHAIGDRNAVRSFDSGGPENSGAGRLHEGAEGATILVDCRTVDAVCEESGLYPDVVKLDIEGGELDALRGMAGLLRTRPPRALLIELHGFNAMDPLVFYDDIRTLLIAARYRLFQLDDGGLRPPDPVEAWPSRTHVLALQPGVDLPNLGAAA
jgi:FkbM family methyltransferase